MKFIDYATIEISSGNGGAGCVSFRREKFVEYGGPDGGDGGRGAHVIIKASKQLNTLLDFRYKRIYTAEHGKPGMGQKRFGRDGKDTVLPVPIGTIIRDVDTGEVLADLNEDGAQIIVAKGGKGGKGNVHFATAVRQAPKYAQPGLEGQHLKLELELKLLADVGLVGLPNAGKSTLIAAISNARPKIADYPFTTLVPNLGVVKHADLRSFVVADIPGLIEGAHQGTGLGFQFLRHIQRTSILLHMVDTSIMAEGDPVENLKTINRELELYGGEVVLKQMVYAATKCDVKDEEKLDKLRQYCKTNNIKLFEISAAARLGLDELLVYLSQSAGQIEYNDNDGDTDEGQ